MTVSDTNGSHPDEVLAVHDQHFSELALPVSLFGTVESQEMRDSTDIGLTMRAIW